MELLHPSMHAIRRICAEIDIPARRSGTLPFSVVFQAHFRHTRRSQPVSLPRGATSAGALVAAALLVAITAGSGTAAGLNGRIAIVSNVSGNDDIATIASDGSAPETLTNDAHADMDPAYSSDGLESIRAADRWGRAHALAMGCRRWWRRRADTRRASPRGIRAGRPTEPISSSTGASATSGRDLWVIDATGTALHSIVTHAGSEPNPPGHHVAAPVAVGGEGDAGAIGRPGGFGVRARMRHDRVQACPCRIDHPEVATARRAGAVEDDVGSVGRPARMSRGDARGCQRDRATAVGTHRPERVLAPVGLPQNAIRVPSEE